MRKISLLQIIYFSLMASVIISGGVFLSLKGVSYINVSAYAPILTLVSSLVFSFTFSIITYRAFLYFKPIPTGYIKLNSEAEFSYHIHLLFHLLFFHPIIRSNFLPVPLMKLITIGLGAKMGKNSFSSGTILDGQFVEIGDNCLIGHQASLIPHAIENEHLSHEKIILGNNVTIGTGAVIFQGVVIEDGALVSANAVVVKGTHIGKGEIWGGIPARLISKKNIPTKSDLKKIS